MSEPQLLAIIEMGGYPDFTTLYQDKGFVPSKVHSVRKAQGWLKKKPPGGGGGRVSLRSGPA